jgi:hypothetical protein
MSIAMLASVMSTLTLREERRYTQLDLFRASGSTHMLPLSTGEWLLSDQFNNRVLQLQESGGDLRLTRVIGQGALEDPRGMATDDVAQLFVADFGSHRVAAFRLSDGVLLHWYGERGMDDGELMGPFACAVWSNELFVSDWGNNRIAVWSTVDRRYLRAFGPPANDGLPRAVDGSAGHLFGPAGIAFASGGRLFVGMLNNDTVAEFTAQGQHVNSFGCGVPEAASNRPYGVAVVGVAPTQVVACAEFLGSRSVHLHNLDGDLLSSLALVHAGRLAHLASVPPASGGSTQSQLLVVDSENNWVATLAIDELAQSCTADSGEGV